MESLRKNIDKACDFCRYRHIKCDGQVQCIQCNKRGRSCTYLHQKKRDAQQQNASNTPPVGVSPVDCPLSGMKRKKNATNSALMFTFPCSPAPAPMYNEIISFNSPKPSNSVKRRKERTGTKRAKQTKSSKQSTPKGSNDGAIQNTKAPVETVFSSPVIQSTPNVSPPSSPSHNSLFSIENLNVNENLNNYVEVTPLEWEDSWQKYLDCLGLSEEALSSLSSNTIRQRAESFSASFRGRTCSMDFTSPDLPELFGFETTTSLSNNFLGSIEMIF